MVLSVLVTNYYNIKNTHSNSQTLVPRCCGLESADSRFMSVMMTFWVRAGEQGRSGLQGGAAGVMRVGQGEAHGEG